MTYRTWENRLDTTSCRKCQNRRLQSKRSDNTILQSKTLGSTQNHGNFSLGIRAKAPELHFVSVTMGFIREPPNIRIYLRIISHAAPTK